MREECGVEGSKVEEFWLVGGRGFFSFVDFRNLFSKYFFIDGFRLI